MATLKLLLREHNGKQLPNGNYPVVLRITKDRKSAFIYLGYNCNPKYWDKEHMRLKVRPKHPNYEAFQKLMDSKLADARNMLYEFDVENPTWRLNDFKKAFRSKSQNTNGFCEVIPFIEKQIELLRLQGKHAQADNFNCVKAAILNAEQKVVYFEDITVPWLESLKLQYARKNQIGRSTFKNLRTIFNYARKSGELNPNVYPFGELGFTLMPQKKTEKGISLEQVKSLKEFRGRPQEEYSIKIFLLMIYLIGIEWKDLCLLKKKNYKNGRIEFTRAKTSSFFSHLVIPPAKEIIEQLSTAKKANDFLLPILPPDVESDSRKLWRAIGAKRSTLNKWLKSARLKLGIEEAVTTKVSKYTWASVARNDKDLPITIIQDAFGHTDNRTTDKYAQTRGHKHTDDINMMIWDS